MGTIVAIIAVFAWAGAAWGWRHATQNIKNPPDKYNYPGGMSRNAHLRMLVRKHRDRRLPLTIGTGLACGFFAFALLVAVAVIEH